MESDGRFQLYIMFQKKTSWDFLFTPKCALGFTVNNAILLTSVCRRSAVIRDGVWRI